MKSVKKVIAVLERLRTRARPIPTGATTMPVAVLSSLPRAACARGFCPHATCRCPGPESRGEAQSPRSVSRNAPRRASPLPSAAPARTARPRRGEGRMRAGRGAPLRWLRSARASRAGYGVQRPEPKLFRVRPQHQSAGDLGCIHLPLVVIEQTARRGLETLHASVCPRNR